MMLTFDPSQPLHIFERDYECSVTVVHQGIAVTPPIHEVWKELDYYKWYPKYRVATEQEKQMMIAKALWSRLHTVHGKPV